MSRRIAFVLAATDTGPMILNRLDFSPHDNAYGPGTIMLEYGDYERTEADAIGGLLLALRKTRGDGVLLIDGGANCGAHTVNWASGMQGWGEVLAIEPQRHVYYALCGNIALNNLFNVNVKHGALSDRSEVLDIPVMDYRKPFPSGSMSLLTVPPDSVRIMRKEAIGSEKVKAFTIDSLNLARLDLLKLDIEGMEPQAIFGGKETIGRCRPVLSVEHLICGQDAIRQILPGYELIGAGINTICIPKGDPIRDMVSFNIIEEAA